MQTCKNCLWGDKCSTTHICNHFASFDEDYLDNTYDRTEYFMEWAAYMKEDESEGGIAFDNEGNIL